MNQLTQDLEGTLPYNNDLWIDFRIVIRNLNNLKICKDKEDHG
jgi:hypothetical protein